MTDDEQSWMQLATIAALLLILFYLLSTVPVPPL